MERVGDEDGAAWSCEGWGAHVLVAGRDADPDAVENRLQTEREPLEVFVTRHK